MNKTISFCTTCCNRLWQIKETLPKNLDSINDSQEIVLVDYGSTDGLSDWIWKNFRGHIDDKKLNFFEVKNEVRWNVARAKNLAHRLALGEYLFNLDADNFLAKNDLQLIEGCAELKLLCHQWSKVSQDGSFGRIGTTREMFFKIGGYDETLLPMGGQDVDILNRLYLVHGKKIANLDPPAMAAVPNTFDEKIKGIGINLTKDEESEKLYREVNSMNLSISKFKFKSEGPIRLGGGFSYKGMLNGRSITINGFDEIKYDSE